MENSVDEMIKRSIELASEKSAGAWLTALPFKNMGYRPEQTGTPTRCLPQIWMEDSVRDYVCHKVLCVRSLSSIQCLFCHGHMIKWNLFQCF